MSIRWTAEQILAMAPDASSQKAGRGLASASHWVSLGRNEEALWGECKGSASTPYQTQIESSEPAFKCSCPSRKCPCKHGLGLLLLLQGKPELATQTEPPSWVADWLSTRTKREEKKAQKAAQPPAPTDVAAQAKRAEARLSKVTAGIDELELWIYDLLRQGLASAQGKPYEFWMKTAARMEDAQAPGLARMVRSLRGVVSSGDHWHDRLLVHLGQIHLLIQGFRRLDSLPPPFQSDVRTAIGWTYKAEEVMQEEGVADQWRVVGVRTEEEEGLKIQRTWLSGAATGRTALILQFAHPTQRLESTFPPGDTVEGSLAFFPGSYPLRAVIKERMPVGKIGPPSTVDGSILSNLNRCVDAMATNPWIGILPMTLNDVVPVPGEVRWQLRDSEGRVLPVRRDFQSGWRLLSVSGGRPLDVFGEWDGSALLPVSGFVNGRIMTLT